MMKVVFCWSDISGYMASCWRALSQVPGIDLKVIAFGPTPGANAAFAAEQVMAGIDHRLLSEGERKNAALIGEFVRAETPDVIVTTGWGHKPYVALASDSKLNSARLVLGIDTPWRGDLRQWIAPIVLRRYLARADALVVAGERAFQYASRLIADRSKIYRGIYGIDFSAFNQAVTLRDPTVWPRKFLFIGRYEPSKAIDVLVSAYDRYRAAVSNPWSLTCCGRGDDGKLLKGCDGIEDRGFVQPADQPQLFADHGAFLLTSRYEPWGVVIAEACAAGLPVICTEACSAGVELVRSTYNGFRVPTDSPSAFAAAMIWFHHHEKELRAMGQRSTIFAGAHDAHIWARYWSEFILRNPPVPISTAEGPNT